MGRVGWVGIKAINLRKAVFARSELGKYARTSGSRTTAMATPSTFGGWMSLRMLRCSGLGRACRHFPRDRDPLEHISGVSGVVHLFAFHAGTYKD